MRSLSTATREQPHSLLLEEARAAKKTQHSPKQVNESLGGERKRKYKIYLKGWAKIYKSSPSSGKIVLDQLLLLPPSHFSRVQPCATL